MSLALAISESFFGSIRGMGGNVSKPNALQFNRRVGKWIVKELLKVNFNIFTLKKTLPSTVFQPDNEEEWKMSRQSFRNNQLREDEK